MEPIEIQSIDDQSSVVLTDAVDVVTGNAEIMPWEILPCLNIQSSSLVSNNT